MPIDLIKTAIGEKYSKPEYHENPNQLKTLGAIDYSKLDGISKYAHDPNFDKLGYSIFQNNEYVYQANQTTGQYWSNTFKRFMHPATTAFMEGFSFDKTIKELTNPGSITNDEDLKNYIKTSEELQDLYPIYENPYTKDGFAGYFSRGASTKWSSILENSGFMAGTALSGIIQSIILGVVTAPEGGSAGVLKVAETVGKMSKIARMNTLSKAYRQLNSVAKVLSPGYKSILGIKELKNATTVGEAILGGKNF
jgi:hypothetical protein